jgi:SagB-type dehydrogenase family enzyme
MRSTDASRTGPPGSRRGAVRGEDVPEGAARTEQLFAGDDTSNIDAFHAGTTWGRTLERGLASRIGAFLTNPVLRKIVAQSHNEHGDSESIALPDTGLGSMTLQDALVRRRSLAGVAHAGARPIGVDDLAAILKYSYGIVGEQRAGEGGSVQRLRACPSAGALYPLEIYPVVMDVAGLAPGVYHYDPVNHALSCLRREDARTAMPGFDLQPTFRQQASAVFIVTAVLLRSTAKYLDRGYRFVMNEAGALTQNLQLAALARGVPGCVWGGFCDKDVANYVGADGTREIVVLGFIAGMRPSHANTAD